MNPTRWPSFNAALGDRRGQEWETLRRTGRRRRRSCSLHRRTRRSLAARAAAPRAPVAIPSRSRRGRRDKQSTQEGFGKILIEHRRRRQRAGATHRHHLAGRHRLDQSRPAGSTGAACSAPSEAAGRVPRREVVLGRRCGARRRAASTSSSASPRTTCSCCWPRWAWPTSSSARGCCRSARSTTRSSTAASMR